MPKKFRNPKTREFVIKERGLYWDDELHNPILANQAANLAADRSAISQARLMRERGEMTDGGFQIFVEAVKSKYPAHISEEL